MKTANILLWAYLALVLAGFNSSAEVTDTVEEIGEIKAAEAIIDAFYSWDAKRLEATLNSVRAIAPREFSRALYYQAWAEAGNYAVQTRRPCAYIASEKIACAITVTDDIGAALGYIATDTFHLSVRDGRIVGIDSTSDDPPILQAVFTWLENERPEVLSGPCKGLFNGGTTPAQCVRAVIKGAQDFVAR